MGTFRPRLPRRMHAQLGNQEQSRDWLARAMLEKDKVPAGHSDLNRLFNEAISIIEAGPDPRLSLPRVDA